MRTLQIVFILLVICCNSNSRAKLQQVGLYGKKEEQATYYALDSINRGLDGQLVWTEGRIDKVCPGEGCWITLRSSAGEVVLAEVKNKSFQLPLKIENRKVRIWGEISPNRSKKYVRKIIASGFEIQAE